MSYYPFILALGIAGLGAGFLSNNVVIAVGAVILIWGLIGWAMEPVNDPE
jgi:membrane-bound ClpP family serine protease